MYNIRIKSVPNKAKTGSQLDYSLVDRNTLFLKPNTPVDSDVKNTMGAVPREKANIEAEGGETIVGDINNDGYLEHQTIVGKRHTQGGVPLNVPEGSFIFSDTKKMIIKDPEILVMFGMKPSKKGYTPAEIAKKYNINDYIAILKDPAKDKYSKETAQIMLNSNLKKLGMLALVQESMKGFPDGVPAIAESVMGQMMGGGQESSEQEFQEGPQAPQEEMQEEMQPMQRYGGTQLPKAQFGFPYDFGFLFDYSDLADKKTGLPDPQATVVDDQTKTGTQPVVEDTIQGQPLEDVHFTANNNQHTIPKIGDTYYVNGKPVKISEVESSSTGDWLPNWLNDPSGIYFTPNGKADYSYDNSNQKYYLTFDEFNKMRELGSGDNPEPLTKNGRTASSWWTADDNRQYNFGTRPFTQPAVQYDDKHLPINVGNIYDSTNGKFQIIDTQYTVPEKNPLLNPNPYVGLGFHQQAVKVKNLETGTIQEIKLSDLSEGIDNGLIISLSGTASKLANPDASGAGTKIEATTPSNDTITKRKEAAVVPVVKTKREGTVFTPVRSTGNSSASSNTDSGFNFSKPRDTLRYGGIPHMAEGGSGPGGRTSYNPDTNTMDTYDASGKLISSVPYTGTSFNVKNKSVLEKAKAAGYDVTYNPSGTKNNYIPEQTQKTGFKVNQKSGFYEAPGYEIGEKGFDNFYKFWSPELQGYKSATGTGPEAWKTDFLKAKGAESEASRYLGDVANQQSVAAGFGPQLDVNQKNRQGKGVAYIPGNQYYNLKKFNKTPVTPTPIIPEIPAKKDDVVKTDYIPNRPPYNGRSWSKNATLNFMNAFGSRIYRGDPVMQRFKGYTPDYVLPNPAQAIAHVLSGNAALNTSVDNSLPGNVGFAAKLKGMGEGLDQTTKIQSDYDNAGAGIYNNAQAQGAQALAATDAANQKANYQYNNDRQVLDQQWANSFNKRNSNIYKASILANSELANMDALSSMLPQVGFNYWNKNIGWSGVGRDYSKFDPYQNPFGNGSAGSKGVGSIDPDYDMINAKANSVYESSYNTARKTMTEEDARAYARQAALGVLKMKTSNNANAYNNTPRNVYNQMFNTSSQYADQDNDVSQG